MIMRRNDVLFFVLLSAISAISYAMPWLFGWTQPNAFSIIVGVIFAIAYPLFIVKMRPQWR